MKRTTLVLASLLIAACTSAGTVTANDASSGKTLVLRPGQELRVVLSSTYWQFANSSNLAVLVLVGQPQVHPEEAISTGRCVPGQGCGTAIAIYRAVSPGEAVVRATRLSCGEALRCTGDAGSYSVRVTVER